MLRVVEHYAITDTGRQRRANEDSMLARAPLFVVADGMGGAQAGEVASRIAVETFGEDGQDFSDPERALAAYAHDANARIHELSHSDAAHAGMGTTLSAMYVGEQDVTIAHVGDSRVYCLRDGELLRLTDDHSLVDELIRQGRLTPQEAEEHPQRSIITRALGPEPQVEVDTRSFKARPGDLYLLCSDGLTSMVGEERMAELLAEHPRLRDAGRALIEEANSEGGRDNITAVLIRLEEIEAAEAPEAQEHATLVGVTPEVRRRMPRMPDSAGGPGAQSRARPDGLAGGRAAGKRRAGRLRRSLLSLTALTVAGVIVAAAYLAIRSVYFIGTDSNGLIAVYNGLPYQLPGGIDLYSVDYVSGVPVSTLAPQRRHKLLDHSLRLEGNASELVRKLELEQTGGGLTAP